MDLNQNEKLNSAPSLNWRFHLLCVAGLMTSLLLAFILLKDVEAPLAGRLFGAIAICGFLLFGCGTISYSARTGVWWTSGVILEKPLNKTEKILFIYSLPTFLFSGILGALTGL